MVQSVGGAGFWSAIADDGLPVLVDFWAPWCGPCRALNPVLDQIAADMEGRLRVVRCNVDDEPAIAQRLQIVSIPTLMLFRDGRPAHVTVGMPEGNAKATLEAELGAQL